MTEEIEVIELPEAQPVRKPKPGVRTSEFQALIAVCGLIAGSDAAGFPLQWYHVLGITLCFGFYVVSRIFKG